MSRAALASPSVLSNNNNTNNSSGFRGPERRELVSQYETVKDAKDKAAQDKDDLRAPQPLPLHGHGKEASV